MDPAALDLFGEETLRKYMVLPLRFKGDTLVVAMSDPNDIYALEDLRIIAKRSITPVVATEEDLQGAFFHLFGGDDGLYPEEESAGTDLLAPEPLSPPEEEYEGEGIAHEGGEPDPGNEDVFMSEPPGDGGDNRSLARISDSRKKVAIGGGRIGDILVAEGKITEDQLEHALMMQKDDPREVGKILVSLGYIEKADLARALAHRLRLDFVELSERDVDKGVASMDKAKCSMSGVAPL